MYRYLDRDSSSLDPGSRFLLWAIRAAGSAITDKRCLGAALGAGFHNNRVGAALPHFAIAMAVLIREAPQSFELVPPGEASVCENEALLLTMFGAVDDGADARVQALLKLIGHDDGAVATLHRAIRTVTAHLLEAGIAPPNCISKEVRP